MKLPLKLAQTSLLLVLLSSCFGGAASDDNGTTPGQDPVRPDHGIKKVELLMTDSSALRVTTHRYKFSAVVNGDNKLIAIHNGMTVGNFLCLEYEDDFCSLEEYSFDFVDRSDHFKAVTTITRKRELIPITYYEKDKHGNVKEFEYAKAQYAKVETNNKVVHSISIAQYTSPFEIKDQIYFKKITFKDNENQYITIATKLPKKTSRNQNIYTDFDRDGFRSRQESDFSLVHYYEGCTIFKAVEAKDEDDRFSNKEKRKVGLSILDLDDLINN